MSEFFAMGGYAFHVWSSWGLTFLLLGTLSITRYRKFRHNQILNQRLTQNPPSRQSNS